MGVRSTATYKAADIFVRPPRVPEFYFIGTLAEGAALEDEYGWPDYTYRLEYHTTEEFFEIPVSGLEMVVPDYEGLKTATKNLLPAELGTTDTELNRELDRAILEARDFGLARRVPIVAPIAPPLYFPLPLPDKIDLLRIEGEVKTARIEGRKIYVDEKEFIVIDPLGRAQMKEPVRHLEIYLSVPSIPNFPWDAIPLLAAHFLCSSLVTRTATGMYQRIKVGEVTLDIRSRDFQRFQSHLRDEALRRLRDAALRARIYGEVLG